MDEICHVEACLMCKYNINVSCGMWMHLYGGRKSMAWGVYENIFIHIVPIVKV